MTQTGTFALDARLRHFPSLAIDARLLLGRWIGLAFGLAFLVVIVLFHGIRALQITGGHFGYYLDDTYIHLAIARNLALQGVWGVTPLEFSSSSSSILWTLVLAALIRIFGDQEWIPFAVNLCLAGAILAATARMLTQFGVGQVGIAVTLGLLVLIVPLPELVYTGMEHTLHSLLTVLFLPLVAVHLVQPARPLRHRSTLALIGLAALLPLARYEGLFAVAVASTAFFIGRRVLLSLLHVGAAAIPVSFFALFSVSQGWFPLPNSVLLKGGGSLVPGLEDHLTRGLYEALIHTPYPIAVCTIALILCAWRLSHTRGRFDAVVLQVALFVAMVVPHVLLVGVRWINRYDAYLVATGILVVAAAGGAISQQSRVVAGLGRHRWQVLGALAAMGLILTVLHYVPNPARTYLIRASQAGAIIFGKRGWESMENVPPGIGNIYEQQYQMGRFVRRYYRDSTVALNDLGAVAYLGQGRILDLFGLASLDVAKTRRARPGGKLSREDVEALALANDARIAMVYDHLLYQDGVSRIPESWHLAGTWRIRNNVVAAGETVYFYAINPEEHQPLVANLLDFAPELPSTVGRRVYP